VRNEEWEISMRKKSVARLQPRSGRLASRSPRNATKKATNSEHFSQQSDTNGGIFFWLNMYGHLYICMDRDAIAKNKRLSLWTQLKVNEIHASAFCIKVVDSRSQIDSGMSIDAFQFSQSRTNKQSSFDISGFSMGPKKTKRILKVAVGPNHMIFMTQNRELYALGRGRYGACGTGTDSAEWIFQPVEVCFQIPNTTFLKKLSCGVHHTLLLLGNGDLFGFGSNHFGELGFGKETKRVSIPQRVHIPSVTETFVIDMDCSQNFSVVVTKDYKVFCCGTGSAFGQRGELFVLYKLDMTSFRCLSDKYLQRLASATPNTARSMRSSEHTPRTGRGHVPHSHKRKSSTWDQLLEANNVIDSLQESLVTKSEDDLFDDFRIPQVERVFCGHQCTFFVTTDQRVFFVGENSGIIPSDNTYIAAPTEIYLESLEAYHPSKQQGGAPARKYSDLSDPDELRPTIDDIYSTKDFVHILRSYHEKDDSDIFLMNQARENVEYGL